MGLEYLTAAAQVPQFTSSKLEASFQSNNKLFQQTMTQSMNQSNLNQQSSFVPYTYNRQQAMNQPNNQSNNQYDAFVSQYESQTIGQLMTHSSSSPDFEQAMFSNDQSINQSLNPLEQSLNHLTASDFLAMDQPNQSINQTNNQSRNWLWMNGANGYTSLNQSMNQLNNPFLNPMYDPINQSINSPPMITRSLGQFNQPAFNQFEDIKIPFNQSNNQSFSRQDEIANLMSYPSASLSMNRSISQSMNQSTFQNTLSMNEVKVDPSINQSNNQSSNQSGNPLDYRQQKLMSFNNMWMPNNQAAAPSVSQPATQPASASSMTRSLPVGTAQPIGNVSTVNPIAQPLMNSFQSSPSVPIRSLATGNSLPLASPPRQTHQLINPFTNQVVNHQPNNQSRYGGSDEQVQQPQPLIGNLPFNRSNNQLNQLANDDFSNLNHFLAPQHNLQPLNQPINQPINQPTNQQMQQPVAIPANRSFNMLDQLIRNGNRNQSNNQSNNQTNNQTNNHIQFSNALQQMQKVMTQPSAAVQPAPQDLSNDSKVHSCNLCTRSFNSSARLTHHMRTHNDTRPFRCGICDKSFNHKGSLTRHIRAHNLKEKPHACDICQKRFYQMGNLTVHMRTHSGEKPYSCKVCDKRFNHRSSLNVHSRNHVM